MHAISEHTSRTRTVTPLAVGLIAAAAYWFAGYLPWLLTGLNGADYLYVVEYDHHAAAPLDLTNLGDLIRYSVLGGVFAGLCSALGGRRQPDSVLAGLTGTAVALFLVHLQSYVVTHDAETTSTTGDDSLIWLILMSAAASCAGWALGVLALRGGLPLALLLSIVAATAPAWLIYLSRIVTHSVTALVGQPSDLTLLDSAGAWWAATVPFLAAALVTIGALPRRRLAGWPAVLLISSLTGASYTAIAITGLLLDNDIPYGKAAETAREVFWDGLQPDVAGWIAYAVTVAIALAVCHRNLRLPRQSVRRPHP